MNYVNFKLILKENEMVELNGEINIDTIDDNVPEIMWEQNNGLYDQNLPQYCKINGEDLTDELDVLIMHLTEDTDEIHQYLWDFKDENKTVDRGDYLLQINDGAKMELSISDMDVETFTATITPTYNGVKILPKMEEDDAETLAKELASYYDDDGKYAIIGGESINMELPKNYWDDIEGYPGDNSQYREEIITDLTKVCEKIYLGGEINENN